MLCKAGAFAKGHLTDFKLYNNVLSGTRTTFVLDYEDSFTYFVNSITSSKKNCSTGKVRPGRFKYIDQ